MCKLACNVEIMDLEDLRLALIEVDRLLSTGEGFLLFKALYLDTIPLRALSDDVKMMHERYERTADVYGV